MTTNKKRRQRVHALRLGKPTRSAKRNAVAAATAQPSRHRHAVLRFVLIFGLLAGVFYATTFFVPLYRERLFPSCLNVTARLAGAALALLGQDITVTGASISSPRLTAIIVRGCDAVEPIALFVCAVLAFPSPFLRKVGGIVAGAVILAILNLVRIVSLFLIGVYVPRIFGMMHVDVWQGVFIVLALMLWLLWLVWAHHGQTPAGQASS